MLFNKVKLAAAETGRSHKSTRSIVADRGRRWALSALLLAAGACACANAASITNPVEPGLTVEPSAFQPLFDGLAGKNGWLTTVVLVIGSLRLVFKPVMVAIENYVKQTPNPADDARIAKFEAGPVYKLVAFVLDFGASIKLPAIVAPPANPENSNQDRA
jgi:hypothetical protein